MQLMLAMHIDGLGRVPPQLEEHPDRPDSHDATEQRVGATGGGGGGRGWSGGTRRRDGIGGRPYSCSGHQPDGALRICKIVPTALGIPPNPDDNGHPVRIHGGGDSYVGGSFLDSLDHSSAKAYRIS